MKAILDHELAEYAKNWAADLDDEASGLARRAESLGDEESAIQLVRALVEASAILRGADAVMPVQRIEDDHMRACAVAWAWRLRNAGNDARELARILDAAADILDRAGSARVFDHDSPGAPLPA